MNELVMGGMVLETNMNEIFARIDEQNKLERQEVSGRIIVGALVSSKPNLCHVDSIDMMIRFLKD